MIAVTVHLTMRSPRVGFVCNLMVYGWVLFLPNPRRCKVMGLVFCRRRDGFLAAVMGFRRSSRCDGF